MCIRRIFLEKDHVKCTLYVCLALYPVYLSYFVSRNIFGSSSMNSNLGVLNSTLFSEIFRSAWVLLFQNLGFISCHTLRCFLRPLALVAQRLTARCVSKPLTASGVTIPYISYSRFIFLFYKWSVFFNCLLGGRIQGERGAGIRIIHETLRGIKIF